MGQAPNRLNAFVWNKNELKEFVAMENDIKIIKNSGLFDEKWYLKEYPDVDILNMDPIVHYIKYGALLNRNPNADFNTCEYIQKHPEVIQTDINPLVHYIKNNTTTNFVKKPEVTGVQKNHETIKNVILNSNLFDEKWYLINYAHKLKTQIAPIDHFIINGNTELTNPCALFDTKYYLNQFSSDIEENALYHYLITGWVMGKKPNEFFDNDYYSRKITKNELNGRSPLQHFSEQGAPWSWDPSPFFSNQLYLKYNPDVKSANINPLSHYLSSGKLEGRRIKPVRYTEKFQYYRIEKNDIISSRDEILLFVAYSPNGNISNYQKYCLEYYAKLGYKVILIINTDNYLNRNPIISPEAAIIIVRENLGYDFGAWGHVCYIFPALKHVKSLTFTNDSIIPISLPGQKNIRKAVKSTKSEAVFLTRNLEVREHLQSYFFTLKKGALRKDGILAVSNDILYDDINKVIHELELKLSDKLEKLGIQTKDVFRVKEAEINTKNPTIHYYEALIQQGFPFLKMKLFMDNFLSFDYPEISRYLTDQLITDIKEHIKTRTSVQRQTMIDDANIAPIPAVTSAKLFGPIHELQAYNLPDSQFLPIKVPFNGIKSFDLPSGNIPKILTVVHCFYVDIAATIFSLLADTGIEMRLLCTTDTAAKKSELDDLLKEYGLSGTCVVTNNRGRDVAPFIIEGRKHLKDAEIILHLHTKKSPHEEAYSSWGHFLFENLIGNSDIVMSILALLDKNDIGLVYSEHFPPVLRFRNWGYDFKHAQRILSPLGINISADMLLEFPTGTMFWARTEALRPLFDLDLEYDDFEEEAGQTDGTLAHSIERCLLYIAESKHYRSLKVISGKFSNVVKNIISVDAAHIEHALYPNSPQLINSYGALGRYSSKNEIYPVQVCKSLKSKKRFNLIIPTMNKIKIFGGITTALKVGLDIFRSFDEDVDLRVIITSEACGYSEMIESQLRIDPNIMKAEPYDDIEGPTVVDLFESRFLPISLRENDIFFATAWWTADLAFRLQSRQKQIFSALNKVIYLIQDYEVGFYSWSAQSTLSKSTYHLKNQTIPVFNSEELANFMTSHFDFDESFCVPYQLNQTLKKHIKPSIKEKFIIVYGRPSVSRNLFPIIVEGLRIWQNADPFTTTEYHIVFAGEHFDSGFISELENAKMYGKLPLEDYAMILNKSAIGISLMESPHPSYPPLEMASAGCITITNKYAFKDLTKRAPNIISLDSVTPNGLCGALNEALKKVNLETITPTVDINNIPTDIQYFDEKALINRIRANSF